SRACAGPSDIEFAGIGRVRQQSVEGGGTPARIPARRLDPTLKQVLGEPEQRSTVLEIADKQFLDNRAFRRLDLYPRRVSGPLWMQAVLIRRNGPRQEHPGLEFHLASTSHAIRNQGPFVFGHGPTDLHQEMVLGVLPQRLIEELSLTPSVCKFFQQHHLM